jgi:hypothetical protein
VLAALGFWASAGLGANAEEVRVRVDAGHIVRTVDARLFGINVVMWDADFDTPGTLSALRELEVQALRWPGGSPSDDYHWAFNRNGTNPWKWATPFSNFIQVATNLHAQVFITVNYGSGTPEEASAWVRCANITNHCGFQYWEIGNENYGNWEHDQTFEFNSFLWWNLRNGQDHNANNSPKLYGWRHYGDHGIMCGNDTRYPTFYTFKLLKYFARSGDRIVRAASENKLLSVYAARRADGTLSLLVINKSPSATLKAALSIAGFQPESGATMYSYGIPQDEAARTGTGSPDIAQTAFSGAGAEFSREFPPYSATVIVLSPHRARKSTTDQHRPAEPEVRSPKSEVRSGKTGRRIVSSRAASNFDDCSTDEHRFCVVDTCLSSPWE